MSVRRADVVISKYSSCEYFSPSSSAARRNSSVLTIPARVSVERNAFAWRSQNFMPWSSVSMGPAGVPPMSCGPLFGCASLIPAPALSNGRRILKGSVPRQHGGAYSKRAGFSGAFGVPGTLSPGFPGDAAASRA
jgi:hypothetical protein